MILYDMIFEGSLEVKLPTIWTDEKQSRAEAERRGRLVERRSEEKSKKKEDADARKGRKVAKHCVFPMICGSGGSKSRLKRRVRSQLARWEMKKCTPLWREAHFEMSKKRRCGAKHILKSKCTKHLSVGPLLEVEMSKKCTPLWREAHFEVKMYKTHHARTTFGGSDVEKVHAVVARSTCPSQKCKKNWGFWAVFDVKMSKK